MLRGILGRLRGTPDGDGPVEEGAAPEWASLLDDAPPPIRGAGPVAAKARAARRAIDRGVPVLPERSADRLPPGQALTDAWPVLDLGRRPIVDPVEWRLRVSFEGRRIAELDMAGLLALGPREEISDIHCVTAWSRYDNRWHGVPVAAILQAVEVGPDALWAMARGTDGYATSVPVADLRAPGAMLATHWEGEPLTLEHGAPVRLMVPHLYFWKSAKWIEALDLTADMERGFWEIGAYHDRGDPWLGQRYRGHGPKADRRGLPDTAIPQVGRGSEAVGPGQKSS